MTSIHATRRQFLARGSLGLGAAALSSLTTTAAPHFAPKAKRVIYLHMSGAPPHLDLFDPKPELVKRTGQDAPDSALKGKRFAFTSGVPKLLGSPAPSAATARPASTCPTPSRTCKRSRTTSASSAR